MAVASEIGIVHAETFFGGTTIERFQLFIDRLSNLLSDYNNVYFIMDNCSCHGVVSSNAGHIIIKLPAYSPALNPIEECFSCWKYKLKAALEINQKRIMDNLLATESGKNMVTWRSEILRELARELLNVNTVPKCNSFIRHAMTNFAKCYHMLDI